MNAPGSDADRLLRHLLPEAIAERLKSGERLIADSVPEASVLFADIVGFSAIARDMPAQGVVAVLNRVFSAMDALCAHWGAEKVKTVGDAYMAAAGVPAPNPDHLRVAACLALDMCALIGHLSTREAHRLELRIGLHAGPVVAGVIGASRLSWDLWGETVNLASRLESHGVAGRVQVSEAVAGSLAGAFEFEPRGEIELKGLGSVRTWFLAGARPAARYVPAAPQVAERLREAALAGRDRRAH